MTIDVAPHHPLVYCVTVKFAWVAFVGLDVLFGARLALGSVQEEETASDDSTSNPIPVGLAFPVPYSLVGVPASPLVSPRAVSTGLVSGTC